ncbi:MAG TPA: hypothetical protein VFG59_19070 [Anaeromyxobacter sp.]|nr:hypothetical protein [Anaeromyxobacter sp.]
MIPFVLGVLLLLSGCIVYERQPYPPGPPPAPPARRIITEQQAVDTAFRLCQDRDLHVDKVENAHLDSAGRWHVMLVGSVDRAQMLLDGRDGRLLRGRFRRDESPAPSPPPSAGTPPPPEQPGAQPRGEPPPPPSNPPPPSKPDDLD